MSLFEQGPPEAALSQRSTRSSMQQNQDQPRSLLLHEASVEGLSSCQVVGLSAGVGLHPGFLLRDLIYHNRDL